MTEEDLRLEEDASRAVRWKTWGPYLSERQWGTVREDYGGDGDSWAHFTWEDSHSRAYRHGEDGLGGMCDYKQRLCFATALWNGEDEVLNERLFGLTNAEGNHGEDVKEYYFYLDNTPTHSYQKFLYKYPQAAFPYAQLRSENARRGHRDFEYELIDTGVFNQDRYFDVFFEYAKASPLDMLIRITAVNRGDRAAELHLLPTLWFRNTWQHGGPRGVLRAEQGTLLAEHPELPPLRMVCAGEPVLLFTENETGPKAAFHQHVIHGTALAARQGTKAAYYLRQMIPPGGSWTVKLRLADNPKLGPDFDPLVQARLSEADEFYHARFGSQMTDEQRNVSRQALAGLLWTKQYYHFDVNAWIREHHRLHGEVQRNSDWNHMRNEGIISVPDKWEYPWYAAWDLAFHAVALGMVDRRFAKRQLSLMLEEPYLHPNGQLPAYEWNFSDVNPPVHAWATAFLYFNEKYRTGHGDLHFLKSTFHKLLLNFTWWVNRKDRLGRNVFEGGFLGLDNIGLFDRSKPLPTGGNLEQADGTAWMCLYCQNMFEIALELAYHDPAYIDLARKFTEHFFHIASAMDRGEGADQLWDEEEGFFFDVLRFPEGPGVRLKIRSMVGLLPLCAVSFVEGEIFKRFTGLIEQCQARLRQNPEWTMTIHDPLKPGQKNRYLLSVLNETKLRRVLEWMLDPERFFSPHGIRSLSRFHQEHPYELEVDGEIFRVQYDPAESTSGMFGGNSNWRGPVWFPMNVLIIRALLSYYSYYGDTFQIRCAGKLMNLFEVAREIAMRLGRIFLPDAQGRRPVYGGTEKFQSDPHWKDYLLFYEYFHGDNGAGLGASHQTGWTALVAPLLQWFGQNSADEYLERGWADIAGDSRPHTRAIARKKR